MDDQPQKLLIRLSVAFAAFTVLVTLVFFGWWAMKERMMFGSEPFDAVRWMAPDAGQAHACARGDMVLDVKNRLLRPGMTRSDVTVLLGRPAWEEAAQIEYDIGVCLWNVHGLRLYFDGQDRLVHSAIVQH